MPSRILTEILETRGIVLVLIAGALAVLLVVGFASEPRQQSEKFQFVGITETAVANDSHPIEMNNLCNRRFGNEARMASVVEVTRSDLGSLIPQSGAWVAPGSGGALALGGILDDKPCYTWSYVEAQSTPLWMEVGRVLGALFCMTDRRVACSVPMDRPGVEPLVSSATLPALVAE